MDIENELYALDSTTIDLCLSFFPWAKFRRTKAAINLHTLLYLIIILLLYSLGFFWTKI